MTGKRHAAQPSAGTTGSKPKAAKASEGKAAKAAKAAGKAPKAKAAKQAKADAPKPGRSPKQTDPEQDKEALRLRVEEQLGWQAIADRLGLKWDTQAADAAARANGGEKPPALGPKPRAPKVPTAESIVSGFTKLAEADNDVGKKVLEELNRIVAA